MRFCGMILLFVAAAAVLAATPVGAAPEIDPGSAGTAIALLSGLLLVVRSRRAS